MEQELIFELSSFEDERDSENAKLHFIVNRAAGFNREKFDFIVIPKLNDNARSFMLYNAVRMIALARQIPVYVGKEAKHIKWYDSSNQFFSVMGARKLRKEANKPNALIFSDACLNEDIDNFPRIFSGFTYKSIEHMAEILYGYGLEQEENNGG